MRHTQIDHLARTDKQHMDLTQVFKQTAGQANRCGRHADRVRTNFGFATHFLSHRKGTLKQLVECGAQSTRIAGNPDRVFHLPQNLGLAQHHGVQATGHPKRMPCRLIAGQAVGVRLQNLDLGAPFMGQPRQGLGHLNLLASAINFRAIAGRQNRDLFVRRERTAQVAQRLAQALGRKGKALPQLQWRGFVVEAKGPDGHSAGLFQGHHGALLGLRKRGPTGQHGLLNALRCQADLLHQGSRVTVLNEDIVHAQAQHRG